ncbi:hypothetical protein F5B22DRAFT_82080 [Xylaria bambusicola]|uniref:uncharacterized protein n=1 Tax=Xylaria bambusicola TaxID=326684 RepID=UPI002007D488|nr:uncharacterized protein F5B22DRAFT_82080 [Xylaria bambusicola]KAI0518343.1 hypothetical protein F5B22DRAFT_82080 [Xylaria bambusicola]
MEDIASRRRRRPILACEPCRRKKIKCDHEVPCTPCTRSRTSYCSYLEANEDVTSKKQRSGEEHSNVSTASTASTSGDYPPSMPVSVPLSVPLSGSPWFSGNGSVTSNGGNNSTTSLSIAPEAKTGHLIERQDSFTARGTFLRGRFYGPSHWLSFYQHLPHAESDYSLYQNCEPLVGSPSSVDSLGSTNLWKLPETIPPREVSNQLVLAYFRTFESVLRILHVPSFVRECQQYWKSPQNAREEFILQLGLVMAIGAAFTPQVTVKDQSILLWIDSAQNWLRDTLTETCLNQIDTTSTSGRELVQIFCLLIEARQTRHTEKKRPGLISADSLIRAAEHVGLHIHPTKLPGLSFFEQEMRRRLWTTCQELALQAAVNEGRPSPILRGDDNGPPPLNLADEQFDTHTTIVPLVSEDFTHTSILIALHKSFPIRHAIAEAINDVSYEMCSYEQALDMSSRIMTESREIFSRIQSRASNFAVRLCELLLHRFLLTLHAPFALHAHIDPTRYYSRKVATEISMSILRHCSQVETDDFARLLRRGSEIFTHVPILATSILCYDLADEDPFSSTLVQAAFPVTRTSLQKLVDAYLHVLSLRIGSGSEEIRPYVLLSAQLARIAASQAGQAIDHRLVVTRTLQLCQRMQQGQAVVPHVEGQQFDNILGHSSNDNSVGAGGSSTMIRQRMSSDATFDISPEQLDDCISNPLSEDNHWMIGLVQNG